MKAIMVLLAILLSSASPASSEAPSEQYLHQYPQGTEAVIFTKSGDAFRAVILGETWDSGGVLLDIILPGGLVLDIYQKDIDHMKIGSRTVIDNVHPIVQIPSGSAVYEFQGQYYAWRDFGKGYLSLVEALASSRPDDVQLKGLLDDFRRRVRVDQTVWWSIAIPAAGGLAYAAYALFHGLAIDDGNWLLGHMFIGLGIAGAASALGIVAEKRSATPGPAITYYDEAYRKR